MLQRLSRALGFFEKILLSLKPWRRDFDAQKEFVVNTPIWIHFPRIPMELWNDSTLALIGDSLGKFITVDKSYNDLNIQYIAKISDEININQDLFELMDIEFG